MSTRNQSTLQDYLQEYLPADADDLTAELAAQRDHLLQVVHDLSDRYDVPERAQEVRDDAQELAEELAHVAQEGVHELKERATDSNGRPRPAVVIGAGVAVVAVAVLVARRRRKRREQEK